MTDFVGMWHIYEMEGWDEAYFNMEAQAYIEIESNGLGAFQFGLVSGQLDGKVVPYGRSKRFEFTRDGSDEMDAANGSGWVKLKDADELEGEFRFHLGDDSGFCARKANERKGVDMKNESLQKHFESMGARVKFRPNEGIRMWMPPADSFTIDIKQDKRGEFFEISQGEDAPELEMLQVKPKERHLLLYARDGQRFLCGHDERHWFVAGIAVPVSTVRDAKASLMPADIREQVKHLSSKEINRRRNAAFKRQGEWFFIPVNRDVPQHLILKDEPLQRNASSKPHICQELYREGGELVYIIGGQEMTKAEYTQRKKTDPGFNPWNPQAMMRNPEVYARGYVRHNDHATIKLDGWHRVFINAESTTSAVSFLD